LYYWYNNSYFVSTEDAKVTGDFVKITPQISGKLVEFNVKEGDTAVKDQIIGRIEAIGIPDSSVDTSLLRAPVSGLIIKNQARVGEFSSAGSTIAVMIDPSQLYISANIEETKLGKIKPGELVDISIDQFKGKTIKGNVEFIGQASNSAFSLLPSSSGTFTKVVQTVPVSIAFEKTDVNFLPGTNAVVKIHVK
ncbi:MAG TPA: HlyD family efflux transporter periplasmic adaptor subunit, partial [Desulfosporosinus sp.]|nr:HlyD family efflux transporter periplasmic adaptor subunit [Desulfosporosinus sp.]